VLPLAGDVLALVLVVEDLSEKLSNGRFLCSGRGTVSLPVMVVMMINGEM
jgi:hypothetical protein